MRRARIKVTASVPLRRKNIALKDNEANDSSEKNLKDILTAEVPKDELKTEKPSGEKQFGEKEVPPGGGETVAEKPIELDAQVTPKDTEVVDMVVAERELTENLHKDRDKSVDNEKNPVAEIIIPRRPRLFSESSDGKGYHSGSEPASPTKLQIHPNRTSFMRPTPRLDGSVRIRRNSIQGSGASASESEDETRRHSIPHPPPASSPHPSQTPTSPSKNPKPKRKVLVSESVRKLSEARREFHLKHENKTPDRATLKMYDLIYYNPITNPMKKTQNSLVNSTRDEPEDVTELDDNGDDDNDDDDNDDEDSPMPVPQLKVGPNGELVVDEQSLVIENTALKKDREAVAKRRALVDEEGAIGGFYKKRTKSKDWDSVETLKFYKALNVVGTDFSLMQSLFPKRNRHELKMKFKKEEKLNRGLIDKALRYHKEYDIDTLKKELESFEFVEEVAKKKRKSTDSGRKRAFKRRKVATSINLLSEDEDDPDKDEADQDDNSEARKDVEPQVSEESVDEDHFEYRPRATRSGRIPKETEYKSEMQHVFDQVWGVGHRISEKDKSESEKMVKKKRGVKRVRKEKSVEKVVANDENAQWLGEPVEGLQEAQPGSLVIMYKESPDEPGKKIVQAYMVSKNGEGGGEKFIPVDLSSEFLSTVNSGLSNHGVNPVMLSMK